MNTSLYYSINNLGQLLSIPVTGTCTASSLLDLMAKIKSVDHTCTAVQSNWVNIINANIIKNNPTQPGAHELYMVLQPLWSIQ